MIQKLSESRRWQLFFIVGLIVVVPLTVDINGRISTLRHMRQKEAQLETEIANAQDENAQLRSELQSLSDLAYLEEWARVEAHMTKPGEVAIIPLYVSAPQPQDPSLDGAPTTAGTSLSFAAQWRRLFFDELAAP
jgi:cell division protein FtsB